MKDRARLAATLKCAAPWRAALGRAAAWAVVCAAAYTTGCASMGAPPGGPEDRAAPIIVKVTPDSGATAVKNKSVTVTFDEVISERPRTGADLGAVVLLSPSDGPAHVDWHRDAITVRPRKGFRANTAYAVTILPGLSDLRSNAMTKPRTLVFSTGPSIPDGALRGAVFDWTTLRPAGNALIDLTAGGDTTFRWIARSDSLGRYALPYLPAGRFLLRSIIDANSNGRLDSRELWDSVTVSIADSVRVDLYAFTHDTLGARIVGVDVKDSLSVRIVFDRALALDAEFAPAQVELQRADSSRIRVGSIIRASAFDSVARVRAAAVKDSTMRADTTLAGKRALTLLDSARVMATRDSIERARVEARRTARDTVVKVPPPVPARTAITAEFVGVLEEPLVPGAYRMTVRNVLSASRVRRTSERTFSMAKPAEKKAESAADSTGSKSPGAAKPGTAPAGTPAAKPGASPAAKPGVTPETTPASTRDPRLPPRPPPKPTPP